jgi:ribosomal protein S18 acetylase RimI-like enzyme
MHGLLEWRIREAGANDLAGLALIGAATILETYAGAVERDDMLAFIAEGHSAEAYGAYLASGSRIWLAEAVSTGVPLGYVMLSPSDLDAAVEGDVEVKRIYTLTRMQGSGLGRALMDVAIAAASGHKRLLLGVKADNLRAIAFYGKHGFETIGTRRFLTGVTWHHDLVLARVLVDDLAGVGAWPSTGSG